MKTLNTGTTERRHYRLGSEVARYITGLVAGGAIVAMLALGTGAWPALPALEVAPAPVEAGAPPCARSWVSTATGCYEDGTAILDVCHRSDHALYALLRAQWLLSEGIDPGFMWSMLGSYATECAGSAPSAGHLSASTP